MRTCTSFEREQIQENYASHYSNDAEDTLEQFNGTDCQSLHVDCRVPALAYEPALYGKR